MIKRNGTTPLFAALNVPNGTVIGRCKPKRQWQKDLITWVLAVAMGEV